MTGSVFQNAKSFPAEVVFDMSEWETYWTLQQCATDYYVYEFNPRYVILVYDNVIIKMIVSHSFIFDSKNTSCTTVFTTAYAENSNDADFKPTDVGR